MNSDDHECFLRLSEDEILSKRSFITAGLDDLSSQHKSPLVKTLRNLQKAQNLVEDGVLTILQNFQLDLQHSAITQILQGLKIIGSLHKEILTTLETVNLSSSQVVTSSSLEVKKEVEDAPETSQLAAGDNKENIQIATDADITIKMEVEDEQTVVEDINVPDPVDDNPLEDTDIHAKDVGDKKISNDQCFEKRLNCKEGPEDQSIKCERRDQELKSKIKLLSFRKTHENCSKSYKSSKFDEFTSHNLQHSTEKTFKCDQCFKSCKSAESLKVHLRCHSGERPYKCEKCEKSFNFHTSLKRHIMSHNGEKPYKCDQCIYSFIEKRSLEVHIRTHTGEKPFKCDQCEKVFSRKFDLDKHILIHTGEKPYKCDICFNTFRQKGSLKNHYRIHTGEKPFKCEVCGKQFRQKTDECKHRKRLHKNQPSNEENLSKISL